jgi:hypothetical protein
VTAITGTHPVSTRRNVAQRTPRGDYERRDAVAEELGSRLGLKPDSAHQILVGGFWHRAAEIVRSHAVVGAYDRLSRAMQPMNDALDGVTAPPLSSDLMEDTERQDAADDIARVHYLAHPSQESARALARAYGRTMAKLRLEQLALGEAHGFTP